MNSKLWIGAFLLMPGCVFGVIEQDYKGQLEAAIIRTNLYKVGRLLKRRNRVTLRRFNDMIGWAQDTIEERRLLDRTRVENIMYSWSATGSSIVGLLGFLYYFEIGNMRRNIKNGPGELTFKAVSGAIGLAAGYGFYKAWTGPQRRFDDACSILFGLEDTVDEIKEKIKARKKKAQ